MSENSNKGTRKDYADFEKIPSILSVLEEQANVIKEKLEEVPIVREDLDEYEKRLRKDHAKALIAIETIKKDFPESETKKPRKRSSEMGVRRIKKTEKLKKERFPIKPGTVQMGYFLSISDEKFEATEVIFKKAKNLSLDEPIDNKQYATASSVLSILHRKGILERHLDEGRTGKRRTWHYRRKSNSQLKKEFLLPKEVRKH